MGHPANIGREATIYPPAVPTATVVVDPRGHGDVSTIADAIAALPAAGGYIQLSPGIHTISATIALPLKPIVIRGAGRISRSLTMDATSQQGSKIVINAGVTAFSSTSPQLVFEDLNIYGGSKLLQLTGAGSGNVFFSRVKLFGTYQVIEATGANTFIYSAHDCYFWPSAGGYFLNGGANTGGPTLELVHTEIFGGNITGYPTFSAVECSLTVDTLFYIGSRSQFTNCLLSTGMGGSILIGETGGGTGLNSFTSCTFSQTVTVRAPGCSFINCAGGSNLSFQVTATGTRIVGTLSAQIRSTDTIGWKDLGNVQSVAADTVLNDTYRTVLVDASGAIRTMTLPAAANYRGKIYTIRKVDTSANAVIVDANGAELIDGNTTVALDHYLDFIEIQSDGVGWQVLALRISSTHEPMGLPASDDTYTTFSWNNLTKVLTIAPVGPATSFDVWVKGVLFRKGSTSIDISATVAEGVWYFYFDGTGTLQGSQVPYVFSEHAPVVIGYYDAAAADMILLFDERHAFVMDWSTHEYLHDTRGFAIVTSGFGLSGSTTGSGAADVDAEVGMSGGDGHDEDLEVVVTDGALGVRFRMPLSLPAQLPVYYRTGAATAWRKKTANAFPVLEDGANRVKYNLNTAGTWTQPNVTANGRHLAMWICATNNYREPIIAILGQREDVTLANAQLNNTFAALNLAGFPSQELKVLWRVIFQTATTYANTPHARIRDITDYRTSISLPGGGPVVTSHNALTGRDIYAVHPRPAIQMPVATVTTTPITLSSSYDVVLVDTTVGDITLNLPAAADYVDRSFTIMKKTNDLNTVIIEGDGAETINGQPNVTLTSQWETVRVVSDGTAWFVI